jgi:hypothetical protein
MGSDGTALHQVRRPPEIIRDGVLLDASASQSWEAVTIDRTLPGEKFFDGKPVRPHASSSESNPPRTAATTSALRRGTQRFGPDAGRSAIDRGLPSGPITCGPMTLWWLSFRDGSAAMYRGAERHPSAT